MRILLINLRHLYQRRTFLLAEIFGLIIAFFIVIGIINSNEDKSLSFILSLIWVFVCGSFFSTLIIDVLNKPFTYCLPGQRTLPVKFLFFIGVPVCLLWAMVCPVIAGVNLITSTMTLIVVYLSTFSVFTIIYWLGVFGPTFKNGLLKILFAIILSILLSLILPNAGSFLVHEIITDPFVMKLNFVIGIISCIVTIFSVGLIGLAGIYLCGWVIFIMLLWQQTMRNDMVEAKN